MSEVKEEYHSLLGFHVNYICKISEFKLKSTGERQLQTPFQPRNFNNSLCFYCRQFPQNISTLICLQALYSYIQTC